MADIGTTRGCNSELYFAGSIRRGWRCSLPAGHVGHHQAGEMTNGQYWGAAWPDVRWAARAAS